MVMLIIYWKLKSMVLVFMFIECGVYFILSDCMLF